MPKPSRTASARPDSGKPAGAGRPTSYRPEFCERIVAYFERTQTDDGEPYFPQFVGFAHEIGVTRNTLLNWCDANPEFLGAYQRAKGLQEQALVAHTLAGRFNASFAGLTAKNLLGWRDRQDLEHSGPNGGPIEFTGITRTIVDPSASGKG